MLYINNTWYLVGEPTTKIERVDKPRENNVNFLQSVSPSSSKDFNVYRRFSVQGLRDISLGKELLVHYRNKNGVYVSGRW